MAKALNQAAAKIGPALVMDFAKREFGVNLVQDIKPEDRQEFLDLLPELVKLNGG